MIRRLVSAAVLVVAAIGAAVMMAAAPGSGGKTYRVDALFDNAGFVIPGQDVKVAGAKVGTVVAVHVTPQRKARVEMSIRAGFAPFRSDADCIIRPQSLIGEKFVDCSPGSIHGKPLVGRDGHAPTVPVANTHSPVDLDLVFDTLRMPVRQRLALVVNELGTGLAGRPRELNAAILRANPALQQSRRVLAILDADRARLGRLIDGSDRVVGALTSRREDIRGFIDRADQVAQSVASRSGDLGTAIDRLPPLLAQLRPAATELAGVAHDGRPVVASLRASAGPLDDLLGDFKPVSDAGEPVLKKLEKLAPKARRAVAAAAPTIKDLEPTTKTLVPIASLGADVTDSLQAKGVVEGILNYLHYGAESLSRFDKYSHILPSYLLFKSCGVFATKPDPTCSARYAGRDEGTPTVPQPPALAAKSKVKSAALDYLLGK